MISLDASGVGYNDGLRGRQFVLRASQGGGVAVGQVVVRAQQDLLIESLSLTVKSGAANGGAQVRLYGTGDAMTLEPTTAAGVFFERCRSITEAAPLLRAATAAAAPSGGSLVASGIVNPAVTTADVDASYLFRCTPFLLGNGCGISFEGVLTSDTIGVVLVGRVL
jgi:hypothetical protein